MKYFKMPKNRGYEMISTLKRLKMFVCRVKVLHIWNVGSDKPF